MKGQALISSFHNDSIGFRSDIVMRSALIIPKTISVATDWLCVQNSGFILCLLLEIIEASPCTNDNKWLPLESYPQE